MIIHSVRLKNIRPYGEGPAQNGVTIPLAPGVNRICGRNGHGKSTLIESIGFALFEAEPPYAENFQAETYLLRHGAREGEIDVTFEWKGETYRVERFIGKSTRRRDKVIQLSDQSICAEGDKEVAAFLRRLFQCSTEGELPELFLKLVGVRQGRLTLPFDCKPLEAKAFFEPLLQVAVFRDCYERLKDAIVIFKEQKASHKQKEAVLAERIRERADAVEAVLQKQRVVQETKEKLAAALEARDASVKIKEAQEKLAQNLEMAASAGKLAEEQLRHAIVLRETAETQVAEAQTASEMLALNQTAYKSHVAAVEALKALEQKREAREKLRQQRYQIEKTERETLAKAGQLLVKAKTLEDQCTSTQQARALLETKTVSLQNELKQTEGEYQTKARECADASGHRDRLHTWTSSLTPTFQSLARTSGEIHRLHKEIAGWDEAKLKAAVQAESEAAAVSQAAEADLAKARQQHQTLAEQLQQISGGVCPFLKEKCRQFDPAKVEADISAHEKALVELAAKADLAKKSWESTKRLLRALQEERAKVTHSQQQIERSLVDYLKLAQGLLSDRCRENVEWLISFEPQLASKPAPPVIPMLADAISLDPLHQEIEKFIKKSQQWWAAADQLVQAKLGAFKKVEQHRQQQLATLSEWRDQLAKAGGEIEQIARKVAGFRGEAATLDAQTKTFSEQLAKLDEQLKPFEGLDGEIKAEQTRRDAHKEGHDRYLSATKIAADLPGRQAQLEQRKSEENKARALSVEKTAALQSAQSLFDPARLQVARDDHLAKRDLAAKLEILLRGEEDHLKREEKRFEEWTEARRQFECVAAEIGRCDASMQLTELARKTLRDTAPVVAQYMCDRIACRAQSLFNQINAEPVELRWVAERYSLRIGPGERRFAMLSGGEQTKLALAMTLAMIEEFSGLRFCVFDEPTYGVDEDSRDRLADAILRAQQSACLDQLLLVSHNEAFETKIEHTVFLKKNPLTGTEVVIGG